MARSVATVLVLLVAWPAAAEEATVVRAGLGSKLDRAVQRSTGGGFWGAVLVGRGGEVLLAKGYGFADYARRPNTARSLFEIASTSKPFTAAAVLKLQMQGKLRLDDPIAKHFEEVPPAKAKITIHHLLTHTSGISPQVGVPYASTIERGDYIRYVLGQRLETEPGETFAYSNAGYALLAALVEVVSGRPFEEYVRNNLFEPAGLQDTGFIGGGAFDADRMTTRLSERTPDATAADWFWGWGYRGMGGVVTTVWDLWRWDRALRGDDVLDRKTRARSYEPFHESYACGWRVDTTSRGTRKVSHAGGVEGYGVNYVRYLEDDAVVVVLSNGKSDVHAVTKTIEDLLFPPPRITAAFDVAGYELNRYGAVEFAGTAAWRVRKDGQQIVLVLEDPRRRHAVATIRLPQGPAKKLQMDLGRHVAGRRAGGGEAPMDAGAYLHRYSLRAGKLEISQGLELRVMPRYTGMDENRRRITDERVTLVLVDTRHRQWPVMAKMDTRSAGALLEDLHRALK
ncbi:MAG: serine hydrolase domain-containing protein [Planctomycetota bacterium]